MIIIPVAHSLRMIPIHLSPMYVKVNKDTEFHDFTELSTEAYFDFLSFVLFILNYRIHTEASDCTAHQLGYHMVTMSKIRLIIFLSIVAWVSHCWAEDGFRICFKETERSSQCQGPSHTCSGWSSNPAWTQSFRDDTNNRGGGCHYQWRIEANTNIRPSQQYRLCFQETEGSSQCQGTRNSCTGWSPNPSWTSHFRDDTDNRGGGCRYAWKIESRSAPGSVPFTRHISACRVCLKETEGSSQCQGNRQSRSGWTASKDPAWTSPFRDDTDGRSGGCAYRWYLDCIPKCAAIYCPRDTPCEKTDNNTFEGYNRFIQNVYLKIGNVFN